MARAVPGGFLLLLPHLVAGPPSIAGAQTPADRAPAVTGVREFLSACRLDSGRLWGRSLCGPLIAVDGGTGFAVATASPPAGQFTRERSLWIGRVPEGMRVANTATDWGGQFWSTVRLPLPDDRFLRIRLLVHEAFHRIQPELDLNAPDAINAHLDDRDGRYLLRLELRALAAALQSPDPDARRAIRDALLFRARRYQIYPGADSLERSLEIQEGLAEYTGTKLALAAIGHSVAEAGKAAAEFESRATYVRSLGYGTGPLLGLLLDRYAARWKRDVRTTGMSGRLAAAVGFTPAPDLAASVAATAVRYGGEILAEFETERANTRTRFAGDYRARLIAGPVIVLAADGLSRSFDPNNLFPLGEAGTVYPTGAFEADWGALAVDHGGALVAPSNREVRVPAPPAVDSAATTIEGNGWRLELKAGWRLRPGPRPGDFTARKVLP